MKASGIAKLIIVAVVLIVLTYDTIGSDRDMVLRGNLNLATELAPAEVRGYRGMIRMNKAPIDMSQEALLSCVSQQGNIHAWPGVVYYINETAAVGMSEYLATGHFPVGSILVKEKQDKKTEDSVKIITVMKKIKSGGGNDTWDYKMYDVVTWNEVQPTAKVTTFEGGVTKVRPIQYASGSWGKEVYSEGYAVKEHTITCIECHSAYGATDNITERGMKVLFKDDFRWTRFEPKTR
ncbi:MAG TPA: hypothetical protein VFC63_23355 [Blastocatellia bacterium]|nr:hypothetical protein [Blastocatellia bacterium]